MPPSFVVTAPSRPTAAWATTTAPLEYIPALDAIRALAVSAVLLRHTVGHRFKGGSIGVEMFFVLSGFLITAILVREFAREGRINLGNFYMRRALRLGPALLALLFVYMLGVAATWFVFHETQAARDHAIAAASSLLYIMNWVRAFHLGPEGFLGHTWSLAVEEQYYLLWPILLIGILVRFGESAWKIIIALFAAASIYRLLLAFQGASNVRIYTGFDTRADALLLGGLLALAPLARIKSQAAKFWLVPVSLLSAMLFIDRPEESVALCCWLSIAALNAAWLILAATDDTGLSRLRAALLWPPLVYLGRISYGIYLWHHVIKCIAWPHVSVLRYSGWANLAITAVATLIIASLSYHFLERPVVHRLRHRFQG